MDESLPGGGQSGQLERCVTRGITFGLGPTNWTDCPLEPHGYDAPALPAGKEKYQHQTEGAGESMDWGLNRELLRCCC